MVWECYLGVTDVNAYLLRVTRNWKNIGQSFQQGGLGLALIKCVYHEQGGSLIEGTYVQSLYWPARVAWLSVCMSNTILM